MKDWYFLHDTKGKGSTVIWQGGFYSFLSNYLEKRHPESYIVSAENTLDFILHETEVKKQIIVNLSKNIHNPLFLQNGYSLIMLKGKAELKNISKQTIHGLACHTLTNALLEVSKSFYANQPEDAEIALKMVPNPENFFEDLTEGYSRKLGRVISAYRHVKMNHFADRLVELAAGFKIKPVLENPFETNYVSAIHEYSLQNPAAIRVKQKWHTFAKDLHDHLDLDAIPINLNLEKVVENIQSDFLNDAYNSLSIEGYQITPAIIEAMKTDQGYEDNKNALAAKGYRLAFDYNLKHIIAHFQKTDVAYIEVANQIKTNLFLPSVMAKILKIKDITGYRDHQVYIKNAVHVPVAVKSVDACMIALADLLKEDEHPLVKAVLGHMFIAYIHPYADGNGRTARFMMNNILSRAGMPWIIVPEQKRTEYFSSLEKACSGNDILPFAQFITRLISNKPLPETEPALAKPGHKPKIS